MIRSIRPTGFRTITHRCLRWWRMAESGQRGRACGLCHLTSGDGHPESASLAGVQAAYIIGQMGEFKKGERTGGRAPVMIAMAQVLSDDEVRAGAEYFAVL